MQHYSCRLPSFTITNLNKVTRMTSNAGKFSSDSFSITVGFCNNSYRQKKSTVCISCMIDRQLFNTGKNTVSFKQKYLLICISHHALLFFFS